MKYDHRHFKIETLLKMAKITGKIEERERYVAEADAELQLLCKSVAKDELMTTYHVEQFVDEKLIIDSGAKTLRSDVYNAYLVYCANEKYIPLRKSEIYRYLQKIGVSHYKTNGRHYFRVLLMSDEEAIE